MRLRCTNCSFELNLSIKSLPKNTRLFCPKCKNVLSPIEEEASESPTAMPDPAPNNTAVPPPQKADMPLSTQPAAPVINPPPIPTFIQNTNPAQAISPTNSQSQLFSEDLKPEFELTPSEEEILKKREQLFSKPEQVWYDQTASPPPIPEKQNITPPPIPLNIPPPIPSTTPPPIPPSSSIPQSGYISASSSIQIDSAFVMSDNPPALTSTQSPITPPTIQDSKIELATENIAPVTAEEPAPLQEIKEEKKIEGSLKVETADKKDVILLSTPAYEKKKISITIPALSLIVLACIAGFIYYQIVVSSSKTEFIKDLKSTPELGTIPAIKNTSSSPVEQNKGIQEKDSAISSKNSKIPIKAKKSALEHYKKGNQYFMEGKYEQARDEYAMATAADPTFGLAYRGLGTTYAKLGQPDLAVKNYEKYIEIMPNASDAEQVKNIIKQYYGK
jgi:hypothetical protein